MTLNKNSKKLLLFISIILVAAFIRLFQLGSVPKSLYWDEVAITWNAYSLWDAHIDEFGIRLPLTFRSFGDYKAPFMMYATAPFIGLFGHHQWIVRLPTALAAIATVGVLYLLALEIWRHIYTKAAHNRLIQQQIFAFLSMGLLAVSAWHILFSRAIYEATVALLFITLGIWLFFFALRKPYMWFFSGFFFILSLYTYHSPKIFLPLLLLPLFIIFRKDILHGVKKYWLLNFFAIILLIAFSFPIVKENILGEGARRIGSTLFFESGELRTFDKSLLIDFVSNIRSQFSYSFFLEGHSNNLRIFLKNSGLMSISQWFFFIVGIIRITIISINQRKKQKAYLLLIWLFAGVTPAILGHPSENPHSLRSLNALPAIILISVYGFVFAYQNLKAITNSYLEKQKIILNYFLVIVSIIFIFDFYKFSHEYFIDYPVYAAASWQYGYEEAVTIAREYEDEVDAIIITTDYGQPHVFTFWYQKREPMLVLWGDTRKYLFRHINWDGDQNIKNHLFVGTPKEIPDDIADHLGEIVHQVYFPDGTVAFRIVQTY